LVIRERSPYEISVLFNLLFFGFIFLFLKPVHFESAPIEKFEIEMPRTNQKTVKTMVAPNLVKKSSPHFFPLEALRLRDESQTLASSPEKKSATELQPSAIDFKREGRELKLWEFIFKEIDENLYFPTEFIDNKITGSVDTTIWFSGDGAFLENETQFLADSNYLKVLVAKTLRKSFANPIPESKLLAHEKFSAHCHFLFEITQPTYSSFEKNYSLVLENDLHFYRHVQKSALIPTGGPFAGLNFVNAGDQGGKGRNGPGKAIVAGFDGLWLPNKIIAGLFPSTKSIDPLAKYREDPAW
jgi:hypothetical protein